MMNFEKEIIIEEKEFNLLKDGKVKYTLIRPYPGQWIMRDVDGNIIDKSRYRNDLIEIAEIHDKSI
jgi:hypothetical protein